MLYLPNRRIFLNTAAAVMGNLIVPDWTLDAPEKFTEGQPGARVALYDGVYIWDAKRTSCTTNVIGNQIEFQFNEQVVFEFDRVMTIRGVVAWVPCPITKQMRKFLYPWNGTLTAYKDESLTFDPIPIGSRIRGVPPEEID